MLTLNCVINRWPPYHLLWPRPSRCMTPFRIKVCGVTDPAVVTELARAQVDAIGLNFAPQSRRRVEQSVARAIAMQTPTGMSKIGVFVDAPLCELLDRYEAVPLDYVQLHGNESWELFSELAAAIGSERIIRAMPWNDPEGRAIEEFLQRAADAQILPAALLIDSVVAGQFGGTGAPVAWDEVGRWSRKHPEVAVVLAGGLTPANVAEAIQSARPDAVDVAGGVERSAGVKNIEACRAFAMAARGAGNW